MKKIVIMAVAATGLLAGAASCGVKKEADAVHSTNATHGNAGQERSASDAAMQKTSPSEIPAIRSDR